MNTSGGYEEEEEEEEEETISEKPGNITSTITVTSGSFFFWSHQDPVVSVEHSLFRLTEKLRIWSSKRLEYSKLL